MKILIVEDEEVAARGLERSLRELLGKKISSLNVEKSLLGSQCFLQENPIDLLFLDLNLDGDFGFDLLKESSAASFITIITSGNTAEAIRAFEYGVLDFVPKPISRERLEKALKKYFSNSGQNQTKYIGIKEDHHLKLIPTKEILYIEADDKKVKLYQKNGKIVSHYKSLELLSKILPGNFKRIHRSYIVNQRYINQILVSPGGSYQVELVTGIKLKMGRNYYKDLKATLYAKVS
ncbi:DNA-binding response regulator [Leptospira biflexa]|uniref:LytR/AlgR family response regulator transcription factor n=1 Tax=Leptospira biflexa TaxID=172 RepID=UPI0010840C3C|nr:LytTR family DNA-binding domain-containing protein [Leptospira biflexa]TGM35119.1 DNA-binding response regulator [Leptospira biflexa]TGM38446.1 DNA-binding response regulator [Leptospira biflexa]TGM47986.1 DNA-binding response regulator [Leptospira biflexa]TGM49549.1 DNA-binding response regulator [Leptospira biflexa]